MRAARWKACIDGMSVVSYYIFSIFIGLAPVSSPFGIPTSVGGQGLSVL